MRALRSTSARRGDAEKWLRGVNAPSLSAMRWALVMTCAVWMSVAVSACQARGEPYRFRGPLVGSVRAADFDRMTEERAESDAHRVTASRAPLIETGDLPRAAPPPIAPSGLADELRSLVGVRDGDSTDLKFALDVLAHLGVSVDAELGEIERGAQLVALARARGAVDEAGPPLLGDLVVFDAVRSDEPASLVGVVVSADRRGTVELIHLSRGIVRRSFVNPRRPETARDGEGRALNTFIRPGRPGDARDTRYLAGELFSAYLRLDRLARRR